MRYLIAPVGVLAGAAVWFLLFVLLGIGLGISFIVGGSTAVAVSLAGGMAAVDLPMAAGGLLIGGVVFVILDVVLSIPLWVAAICGAGAVALIAVATAAVHLGAAGEPTEGRANRRTFSPLRTSAHRNGHDREPVGAR